MREKSFDSINVVPFIDIMLVLLTIVLATATFVKTGVIPIALPVSTYSETAVETVTISISSDGVFYYEDKGIDLTQLNSIFATLSKDSNITVRADKDSSVQFFAELMGLLQELGFEKVNLQTEKSS